MEHMNDDLVGIRVVSQVPLNGKEYSLNEATLKDLGINNNLAYTYHKGLEVTCIQERTKWEWKEMEVGEIGLLDTNFVYPNGISSFGIDYSNKEYNFVKVVSTSNDYVLPVATTTILGGVKQGTNITIASDGTISSTASAVAQGIEDTITTDPLITNDSVIQLEYGSSFAIQHQTGDTVDQPFFQMNTQVPFISGDYPEVIIGVADQYGGLKVGFDINKYDGGFYAIGGAAGLEYYNTPLTLQSNSLVHKAYVDQNVQRIITGNANVENEDNNSTIIIDNGASNITITVDTDSMGDTVCVGFIQQGTGTVTFVASGVTINTPTGLKIKGQNYNAYLEQIGTSNVFHLLGNVIA